ncbi:unnamed protein product [Trichogramma brassicae]|uniref:15-hydroxyprostaglandin dehydrogenase [NAD(+)] n=1 Tax=Trichogramma brassicae TaxID=86971 RepID=A0A6H5J731_9HYME|nr:unnamed protein product [Trichogramma brassicae]
MNIEGKVVIITGGMGGMGYETAKALLENGAKKAVLSCSLLALTHMGKHKGGRGGLIVNVNAILGLTDCPLLPFYSATKHAIIGFTRCMKDNFNSTGVRVVSICPGVTKTNLIRKLSENLCDFISDTIKEKVLTEVPVQSDSSVTSAYKREPISNLDAHHDSSKREPKHTYNDSRGSTCYEDQMHWSSTGSNQRTQASVNLPVNSAASCARTRLLARCLTLLTNSVARCIAPARGAHNRHLRCTEHCDICIWHIPERYRYECARIRIRHRRHCTINKERDRARETRRGRHERRMKRRKRRWRRQPVPEGGSECVLI